MAERGEVIGKICISWCQTTSFINVGIYTFDLKEEDISVLFLEDYLTVDINMPSKEVYKLNIPLSKRVVPRLCVFKLMETKLDLVMTKEEPVFWDTLDAAGGPQFSRVPPKSGDQPSTCTDLVKYVPSQSADKDSDTMELELEDTPIDLPMITEGPVPMLAIEAAEVPEFLRVERNAIDQPSTSTDIPKDPSSQPAGKDSDAMERKSKGLPEGKTLQRVFFEKVYGKNGTEEDWKALCETFLQKGVPELVASFIDDMTESGGWKEDDAN